MSITLTTPEIRPTATTVSLVSFNINAKLKYAEMHFEKGYLDSGNLIVTDRRKIIFQNNSGIADFTFDQLANFTVNAAKMEDIGPKLEEAAISLGIFDGTAA